MRQSRTRRRPITRGAATLFAVACLLSADLLGNAVIPVAVAAAPTSGPSTTRNVTSPPTFQEVSPVPIGTTGGAALPLTDDPTIGRGPAVVPPTEAPTVRTEVPVLRDEHSRTFINPDGSYSLEAIQGRMRSEERRVGKECRL